jgi:hypothetical protein
MTGDHESAEGVAPLANFQATGTYDFSHQHFRFGVTGG